MLNKIIRQVLGKNPSSPIIQIKTPDKLIAGKTNELLEYISFIFSLNNSEKPNYVLNLNHIKKTDILGMLILYKLIEYSSNKKCFYLPEIAYKNDSVYAKSLEKYGFGVKLDNFIFRFNNDNPSINYNITNNFIIAPQLLNRLDSSTINSLNNNLLPKIQEYYTNNEKITTMVSCCLSEIYLNFWEHAVLDTETILAAEGRHKYIEISCADTGNGIVSTLKSNERYKDFSSKELIELAVKRGVTSKQNSNHMGYGLWLLNEIAKKVNGRFHLYSEGVYYKLDYGKVTIEETSYWKGTIVYLALNLDKPISLSDIDSLKKYKQPQFQINYLN